MEQTSRPQGRWSPPSLRRLSVLFGFALLVVAVDQLSKAAIRATLAWGETWPEGWELIRFSHVHNTGAAFGILQGASTFLVIAPLIAVAAITVFLLMLPQHGRHNRWYSLALAAILGGAVGNLIDRIRLGYVTDFIDPTHYPSFNLADSAIVLGVIAIGVLSFLTPEDAEADAAGEEHREAEATDDARRSEVRT